MKKLIDKLLGRESLQKRNDYLVAANNRLGKTILGLRQELKAWRSKPRKKPTPPAKEANRLYLAQVAASRQHHLVKALAKHMPREVFLAECEKINQMTDEQIEALK